MKIFSGFLVLIFCVSCAKPEYKVCEFETNDPELKLYSDVLMELIEQHFHNGYLRQVITKDFAEKYPRIIKFSDTADFRQDLIRLQNKLFKDTAKFESICYRPTLRSLPWKYHYYSEGDFLSMAKQDTTKY